MPEVFCFRFGCYFCWLLLIMCVSCCVLQFSLWTHILGLFCGEDSDISQFIVHFPRSLEWPWRTTNLGFLLFCSLIFHWDFSNYTGSLNSDGKSLYLASGSWQAEFFASINIWQTSFFSFLLLFFLFSPSFYLLFFLFLFKIHPYPECVSLTP